METKDRAQQYEFHSSRDERLGDKREPKPRTGILKRNRSLAIILIDVVFVFVVFLIFRFLSFSPASEAGLGTYQLSLSAFEFDGEVYATLTAEASAGSRTLGEASTQLITVLFPDGTEVTDVLPETPGATVEIRRVFPESDAVSTGDPSGGLMVIALIGEEEVRLEASITR